MQLHMYHGRLSVDQDMDDWGTEGPYLKGVEYIVVTYMSTFRVGFIDQASFDQAKIETGWPTWDELQLEAQFDKDLLVITRLSGEKVHYGDWSLDK